MPNTVIVGAQWGDEGKGKIIDVLAEEADVVVRYQGGNNAGHTVKIGEATTVLHLLPSGILHDGKVCVIGNGVVVDPLALLDEIAHIEGKGIGTRGRLHVSDRAHVVFPHHRALDEGREARGAGENRIGTTKRGIGPCYADKVARIGLRMCDLLDADFAAIAAPRLEEASRVIVALGGRAPDTQEVLRRYAQAARAMAPYVTDTIPLVNAAVRAKKSILFEGAQGTLLDIDFGTYPFVTSSNATAGGACVGTGVPPHCIDRVIGALKAYTTRVGEGPFPTELTYDIGAELRKAGNEFGATTGRPRRCGWFDAVVARYAAMISGIDYWAMTKLDVLDTLATLRVCVAYDCDGRRCDTIPANARELVRCRPVYEEMEGWQTSTRDLTRFEDLPARARAYVSRLCELTGAKLGILSLGPSRQSTLRIAV